MTGHHRLSDTALFIHDRKSLHFTSDRHHGRLQSLRGCIFHGLHRSGQLGVGISGDSSLTAGEIRAVKSLHELRLFGRQEHNGVLESVGRVLSAPRLLVAA